MHVGQYFQTLNKLYRHVHSTLWNSILKIAFTSIASLESNDDFRRSVPIKVGKRQQNVLQRYNLYTVSLENYYYYYYVFLFTLAVPFCNLHGELIHSQPKQVSS